MDTTQQVYDSTEDTKKHINRVADLLGECADELFRRGEIHDASKLVEPEKSGFDSCIPKLVNLTYGSDEYRAALREIKPTLQHHYANNSHHPEFYPKQDSGFRGQMLRMASAEAQKQVSAAELRGDESPEAVAALLQTSRDFQDFASHLESSVNGMNLFDVIEMLMDWKAASERMANGGSIEKSIEVNIGRFGLSPQFANLLRNTARQFGWIK